MENQEVKKPSLMQLIKARYINTKMAIKALFTHQVITITSPKFLIELRLFRPVLDMEFYNGIKFFERKYLMETKIKHWKTKYFHELIICICGFGFGVAKTDNAFLKEIQELQEMEDKLNNVPSYSTPARIKEYKDRVKKLEETNYAE